MTALVTRDRNGRAALIGQMRAWRQKTIAICRDSAHGQPWAKICLSSCTEALVNRYDHAHATGNGSFQASLPDQGRRSAAAVRRYQVITDEEMIEGLSFPSFRRVATMIMVPGAAPRHSSVEMISISPVDLADAQRRDASASDE